MNVGDILVILTDERHLSSVRKTIVARSSILTTKQAF